MSLFLTKLFKNKSARIVGAALAGLVFIAVLSMIGQQSANQPVPVSVEPTASPGSPVTPMPSPSAQPRKSPSASPSPAQGFGPAAIAGCSTSKLFDGNVWNYVTSTGVVFKSALAPYPVVLLRSKAVATYGGTHQPLYLVRLVIADNDCRPQFDSDTLFAGGTDSTRNVPQSWKYFVDATVRVSDVTGDGWQEVLFDSGALLASGVGTQTHVLTYQPGMFKDIALDEFAHVNGLGMTAWFLYAGKAYAVVNARYDIPGAAPCQTCATPYRYAIYQWDSVSQVFRFTKSDILGSTKFDSAAKAMNAEGEKVLRANTVI